MLQDQSRNRTAVPAAQPPAGVAPPEPGPAGADTGIAQMLGEPTKAGVPIDPEIAAEDPALAGIALTRAAYDRAIAIFEKHRREKPGQDLPPAWTSAADAAHDAFLRLAVGTAPTTLAGCQALARLYLDVREGLGVDDEHETSIVLRRIAGDQPATGAGVDTWTSADPHPAMMPEVMRLWREHRRTMSGWGEPLGSDQDRAASAAHNALVDACLAVAELPPPETAGGFSALVTAIGLAFEGHVDAGSDETSRAFGSLITAAVRASSAMMPSEWTGPLHESASKPEDRAPPTVSAPQSDGEGEGDLRMGTHGVEDPIFAAIDEHDVACTLAVSAAEITGRQESEAYKRLVGTVPTTFSGLAALARYLPHAIHRHSGAGAGSDASKALATLCTSVEGVASSAEAKIAAALHELRAGQIGLAPAHPPSVPGPALHGARPKAFINAAKELLSPEVFTEVWARAAELDPIAFAEASGGAA